MSLFHGWTPRWARATPLNHFPLINWWRKWYEVRIHSSSSWADCRAEAWAPRISSVIVDWNISSSKFKIFTPARREKPVKEKFSRCYSTELFVALKAGFLEFSTSSWRRLKLKPRSKSLRRWHKVTNISPTANLRENPCQRASSEESFTRKLWRLGLCVAFVTRVNNENWKIIPCRRGCASGRRIKSPSIRLAWHNQLSAQTFLPLIVVIKFNLSPAIGNKCDRVEWATDNRRCFDSDQAICGGKSCALRTRKFACHPWGGRSFTEVRWAEIKVGELRCGSFTLF